MKNKVASEVSMPDWFASATPVQRDAMTALQLDYQFTGDNLGSQWWIFLQKMGFVHKKSSYEFPESAPPSLRDQLLTSNELYACLDRFAIPQLWSPFQSFPPEVVYKNLPPSEDADSWWRQIRDELVFRKFHEEVKGYQLPPKPKKKHRKDPAPKLKRRSEQHSSEDAGVDLYMRKSKKSKGVKSRQNQRTKQTQFPTLSTYLQQHSIPSTQVMELEARENEVATLFDDWKLRLEFNYSLLLHGVGSKHDILNRFANFLEDDADVVVIDGFHEEVTIEGILNLLAAVWCKKGRQERTPKKSESIELEAGVNLSAIAQQAAGIAKALAKQSMETKRSHYLVLHNIDGAGLRNSTAQEALSSLVCYSKTSIGMNALRLIASVDHVNGPLMLWDTDASSRFQWHWIQLNSHKKYQQELSTTPKLLEKDLHVTAASRRRIAGSEAGSDRKSIFNVLASLAPRHTEALKQLASLQAARLSKKQDEWVSYTLLWKQCQSKCIVSQDSHLRGFLVELTDHGVVEQNEEDESMFSYKIPYPPRVLKQILDFELAKN